MEKIKLQKYFSDCGIMSRRSAEAEIAAGAVRVNGELAYLGMRIDPSCDRVQYKGREITRTDEERLYVLLHKPRGYLTTVSDERGRHTVMELLDGVPRRVYPVGRLDMDSEGLLLLTDDGELTNRLTHPSHSIPKIYHVTLNRAVSPPQLEALRSPLTIDGYTIRPVKTTPLAPSVLEMTLFEGRNRQIRKMCALCSLSVMRLCRVAIGEIGLGELPVGRWRYLKKDEIDYLKGRIPHLPTPSDTH